MICHTFMQQLKVDYAFKQGQKIANQHSNRSLGKNLESVGNKIQILSLLYFIIRHIKCYVTY